METLTQELAKQVEADIRFLCRPLSIKFNKDSLSLSLSDETMLVVDHVICAISASEVADILFPNDCEVKSKLTEIPYASVAVVNLGYRKNIMKEKGFGYLIPFKEGEKNLGCIWDSCVFPHQNQNPSETRLTVMLGGMRSPWIESKADQECIELALGALSKQMGIDHLPDAIEFKMAKKAIPQYELGYKDVVKELHTRIKELHPHLTLIGNAFHGISLNDSIAASADLKL